MLSKKYPKWNCGIEFWNYRIEATRSLNQDCVFALYLESILLTSLLQNPFSTAVRPEGA
jgi:hypothetical protein